MSGYRWRGPLICGHPERKHYGHGMCHPCYTTAYDATHREEHHARDVIYDATHREEHHARDVIYRATHGEENHARNIAYDATHREEHRARDAAYNATHSEENHARRVTYDATHREEHRARDAANRAAHYEEIHHPEWGTRAKRHRVTIEFLETMYSDQDGRCYVCREPITTSKVNVDHDHNHHPGQKGCQGCIRGLSCTPCNHGLGWIDHLSTTALACVISHLTTLIGARIPPTQTTATA